jgi:predicted nucleotidyltransferase
MVEHINSDIQDELQWMQEITAIDALLLFGSRTDGTATEKSDYDICIIAPSLSSAAERAELLGAIWSQLNADKYDVWIFEELPLYLQMNVIQHHEVLFCDDLPELFEYFYQFRKHWRSQEYRQSLSFEVDIDPMKLKEIWRTEP